MSIGPKIGARAPSFTLKDKDGKIHGLEDLAGKYTVVYFYPRDNTPGCTIEAKTFSKQLAKFKKFGASVVGISGGDEKSKATFCKAHNLKLTLLSDPKYAICRKYGAFGEKKFMGRKFLGIFRTTALLDESLRVIKVYEKVTPAEHAQEILHDLSELESTTPSRRSAVKAPAKLKNRKKAASR